MNNTNTHKMEAFGKTIELKELTIGDSLDVVELPENEQALAMVAKAVIPEMTIEELKALPIRYTKDILKITDYLQGE